MVLNNKLDFLFNPIEEKTEYSTLFTGILHTNKDNYILYWLSKEVLSENIIYVINNKGEKVDSLVISTEVFPNLRGILNAEDDYVYLYNDFGEVCLINNEFEIEKIISVGERSQKLNHIYYAINIDEDAQKEFLILTGDEKIFIAEEFFNDITEIEIPIVNSRSNSVFQIVEKHHLEANLIIQNDKKAVFVKYYKNRFYSFRFFILPFIFVLVYIAIYLLTYLQRQQIEKNQSAKNNY